MPEIRFDRIGDLSAQHVVWAFCLDCRRSVKLDLVWLARVHGAELRIADLRQRLTCQRCGRRTREIRLVHDGGSG